jgi:hypothetical protein
MEGQFVIMDGDRMVAGVFSDDEAADGYRRSLLEMPHPLYDSLRVAELCRHCGQHVAEEDDNGNSACPQVMFRILEGLRRL